MVPALPFWNNVGMGGGGDGNVVEKKEGGVGMEPLFGVLSPVLVI